MLSAISPKSGIVKSFSRGVVKLFALLVPHNHLWDLHEKEKSETVVSARKRIVTTGENPSRISENNPPGRNYQLVSTFDCLPNQPTCKRERDEKGDVVGRRLQSMLALCLLDMLCGKITRIQFFKP